MDGWLFVANILRRATPLSMKRADKRNVPRTVRVSVSKIHFDDTDDSSDDPEPLRDLLSNLPSTDLVVLDDDSGTGHLNEEKLLELCDSARASLINDGTLGPTAKETTEFLGAVVKDECERKPTLDLVTIRNTRLDRLLADLLNTEMRPVSLSPQSRAEASIAESLQRQWRARFREAYFDIDQTRYHNLSIAGRLKDVIFNRTTYDNHDLWGSGRACEALSELEGNLQFDAGHWWLNPACAYRDGIVGSVLETPTKGKYGVAALPLLTGREEFCSPVGTSRYTREGVISDMHLSLISRVGSQIRILRGHRLKSPLAPKAGIRYDGLYIIRQYSQRRNSVNGLHRVALTLERVPGQRLLQEIVRVPRPSQLDDWQLFEKFEGEMVRQRRGSEGFLEWKMAKAQEKMDQEQWRRALGLGTELNLAKLENHSRSTLATADFAASLRHL